MNRATFILGFALLTIAATLAVSITLRHAPGDNRPTAQPEAGPPRAAHRQALASTPGSPADPKDLSQRGQATRNSEALRVALPEEWLAALPSERQVEWRARAAAVERAARARLDRLTAELDLSAAQRDKMFPALVRSVAGFDPVMLVGGTRLPSDTSLAALEEMHQALDPQQQALVEDQEVNRQLWWQDTLSRLEANLIESTGGKPAAPAPTPPAPVESTPAAEGRVAPAARETGNLFDLLEGKP